MEENILPKESAVLHAEWFGARKVFEVIFWPAEGVGGLAAHEAVNSCVVLPKESAVLHAEWFGARKVF